MPPAVGNQFWKRRSKHGRDTIFGSPTAMLDAAYEYFEWAEKDHLKEEIIQGGKRFQVGKMRAFTMAGLCIFLDVNTMYFSQFEAKLDPEKNQIHNDFSIVIKTIKDIIYQQKFTGAAAGLLNPNIIARDLGLSDKSTVDAKIETPVNLDKLSNEELVAYHELTRKMTGQ